MQEATNKKCENVELHRTREMGKMENKNKCHKMR